MEVPTKMAIQTVKALQLANLVYSINLDYRNDAGEILIQPGLAAEMVSLSKEVVEIPIIEVRKLGKAELELGSNATHFDYPIVFRGLMDDVNEWCKVQGFRFVKDTSIYGGYYADKDGDAYLLT
jgi:hypothetical protein